MSTQQNPHAPLIRMGAAGVAAVALLAFGVLYLPSKIPEQVADAATPAASSVPADAGAEVQRVANYPRASLATAVTQRQGSREVPPSLAQLHERVAKSHLTAADRTRAIAALDREHAAEPVDAAWSASSELTISNASTSQVIREAGLKPLDTKSDCRSKSCRISATFTDESEAQSWGTAVVTSMGDTLSQARMSVRTLEDGSSEVVIFGTRRG